MIVTGFKPEHLVSLEVRPEQADLKALITPEIAEELTGMAAWTWMAGDTVLLCAGILPLWHGRAQIWSFMSRHAGPYMTPITRSAIALVNEQPVNRLEATTRYDFKTGHRWLKMLGFEVEAPRMRAYDVNGEDHTLYVKIKNV